MVRFSPRSRVREVLSFTPRYHREEGISVPTISPRGLPMRPILHQLSVTGRVCLTLTVAFTALAGRAFGDDGDERIRYYLSRSEMVVAGEIRTEPARAARREGVVTYSFEFQVSHGITEPSPGPRIPVRIIRPELTAEDGALPLKKGKRYILFLNPSGEWVTPTWENADSGFGIQLESYAMHAALRRLTHGAKKRLPKNHATTDELLAALRNYDQQIRTEAIDLLGLRKERRAIEPLIALLADARPLEGSDNWIGGHAANALEAITGGPHTVSQKEWSEWWEKHQGAARGRPESK
jgi:hypothetical protein